MKFKIIFSVLILLIIASFVYAILLSFKLEKTNSDLAKSNAAILEAIKEKDEAKLQLIKNDSISSAKLEECLNEGNRSNWEIASRTNTLIAYSSFVDHCNAEETDCHTDDLKNAINTLLNADGYVQLIETDGNPLYTSVKLSLEGEFVKLNSDKSVRYGPIGVDNCGPSNTAKTGGIVLKDKIIKVLKRCNATSSKSVWAQIQFTN
jgi:hypothetical protein